MEIKQYIIITLRREIDTPEQGTGFYETVKNKLLDHPEVTITGSTTTRFIEPEPETP